ncbi:MAG: hypothetical protein A2X23_07850 [Chloroflexi bacterium GWC2_73_18]|nr:MAG: hypothetical protein A2X23_07850 [Chloroflexi bacterium GWC2_73_18]
MSADYRRWLTLPTSVAAARPCDGLQSEAGSLFDEDVTGAWCDADGRGRAIASQELVLLTRYPCDEGHAAVLTIGRPLGMPIDPLLRWEYVRDPQGEFLAHGWIAEPWRGETTAPSDLLYTGWTNGNVELWISPSELDAAVYLRLGGARERWPRAVDPWGVIDCD